MDVSVNYILSQAYDLIEVNRIDEARELLEPLLVSHADDVDVWWLYAHSVNDPQKARQALERVRSLDSKRYPRAENLLEDLDNTSVMPMSLESLPERPSNQPTTSITSDDEWDDEDEDDEDSPSRLATYGLPVLVALIVTIVFVVTLLRPNTIDNVVTPSSTAISTAQILTVPTVPTTPTVMDAQSQSIPDVKFVTLPVLQKTTELGETTLFQLCIDEYDLSPSQLVNDVMKEIAEQLSTLNVEGQAIGVEMSYCNQNTLYRSVAVAVESAERYAQGDLTEAEYRRAIQAVG
ncbi:MAG: hypothetical protein ACOYLB_00945 [Phototrophicaceae bacterium]